MDRKLINLDANATYGPSPELEATLMEAYSASLNASSIHRGGQRAKAIIEEGREAVRALVGADRATKIVFTSGATEGNNWALLQPLLSGCREKEIVISAIEHPAVTLPAKLLKDRGHTVYVVAPDENGHITPEAVASFCSERTAVVSIMAANNETGYVLPIKEISHAVKARAPQALFHTDAVQVIGKTPFAWHDLNVDVATISAHKFGGVSGIGASIIKSDREVLPLLRGGSQEERLRGGTENVVGVALMSQLARKIMSGLEKRIALMQDARDAFEMLVKATISDIEVNYQYSPRLPNTSSIYVPGVLSSDLVISMDQKGVCISGGSACFSGKPEPSAVLLALGQSPDRARQTVRISCRADIPRADIEAAAEAFCACVSHLRSL